MAKNLIEIPIAQLRPYAGNGRTHSPEQIDQIADSIEAFGFVNPVLIDASNVIIAGTAGCKRRRHWVGRLCRFFTSPS